MSENFRNLNKGLRRVAFRQS